MKKIPVLSVAEVTVSGRAWHYLPGKYFCAFIAEDNQEKRLAPLSDLTGLPWSQIEKGGMLDMGITPRKIEAFMAQYEKPNYYIVNLSHAKKTDPYISFWRYEAKGYAWPLIWAGKYDEKTVCGDLEYYNSGENVAVPCHVIDRMVSDPAKGTIDGDAGPVVTNTPSHWQVIMEAVIDTPKWAPQPPFRIPRGILNFNTRLRRKKKEKKVESSLDSFGM